MKILMKLAVCLFAFGAMLYSYLEAQNNLTQLRIQLPTLVKEVQAVEEENVRLQYEIDSFENPQNLLALAKLSEFSHLHHPSECDILTLTQGSVLAKSEEPRLANDFAHSPRSFLSVWMLFQLPQK